MGGCFQKVKKKADGQVYKSSTLQNWSAELGCKENQVLLNFNFDPKIKHKSFSQIVKDVDRTFHSSEQFKKQNGKQKFVNVLKKFAIFYPKTGYTQGLNFIAGYFLISGASQAQAFTLLAKLCSHQHLMFLGLFQDKFDLNRLYCELFWNLVKRKLPKLYNSLSKTELIDDLWIFQWFMTLFIYSFPVEIIYSFLGYVVTEKKFSMVRIAYGIVKQLQTVILNDSVDSDVYQMLEELKSIEFCKKNLHVNRVLSFAESLTDDQVQKALWQTQCMENFYRTYFLSSQDERQVLYFNKMKKLSEERKQFLKNPGSASFFRKQQSISVLDFILNKQKITDSLKVKRQTPVFSSKLWKSEVVNFGKNEESTNQKDQNVLH